MSKLLEKYQEQYTPYVKFIDSYRKASNAASGSEVDSNANVENKNITTLQGELNKKEIIGTNRTLMIEKLTELYGEETAKEYIRQLEAHEIYKHDETSIMPYTYSAKESVIVEIYGETKLLSFEDLYELCDTEEVLVDEEKLVWCKYPKEGTIKILDREGYTNVSRLVRKFRHRDLVCVDTTYGDDLIVTDNHPLIVSDDVEDTVEAIHSLGKGQWVSEFNIPFKGQQRELFHNRWIVMDKDMGYLIGFFIMNGYYDVRPTVKLDHRIYFIYNNEKRLNKIAKIINKYFNEEDLFIKQDEINKKNWYLEVNNSDLFYTLTTICNIKYDTYERTLPSNVYDYTEDFAKGVLKGIAENYSLIKDAYEYDNYNIFSRSLTTQMSMLAHSLNTKMTEDNGHWVLVDSVSRVDKGRFLESNDFIYDITTDSHSFICNGLWVHNCVSITMYPFLFDGLTNIGGLSTAPNNLDSFCGSFVNLVFAIASQFAGAVSTPEFLMYMDYFIRKEYGNDYYLKPDSVVSAIGRKRTIHSVIHDKFSQVVYSLNQPAAARNFQSVFWNIAYFDQPYFNGMFEDFVFPDGSEPCWDSVNWLQKDFMKWFNAERLKTATSFLSFPVETVNLLDNGTDYVDKEWKDFTAQMWAEGHSFFCYRSNSVDSLASCCFDGDERFITDKGAYSFNEFKPGDKVIVPTHDGTLQKATVNTYGKQELQEITFLKGATYKTVHATKNHRWILDDGSITQNLCIGDKLLKTPGQNKNDNSLWIVKDIKPLNKKELVWCLEVENNHSFLLEDGLVTGNCRLRNEIQENTFSFTLGAGGVSTGSKGVITININRLVQNVYKKNPHATLKDISKAVREQIHKVHCYLTAFNEIIKDNFKSKMLPVYDAGYIALEKQYLSLGM